MKKINEKLDQEMIKISKMSKDSLEENFGCNMNRLLLRIDELNDIMMTDYMLDRNKKRLKQLSRIMYNFIRKIDEVL